MPVETVLYETDKVATRVCVDPDSALVEACIKGDKNSQRKLYEKYAAKMTGICLRYAKNREDARDLMHEGFIKVFVHIKKFQGRSLLKTWITRIMINNAISYLKKDFKKNIHVDIEAYKMSNDIAEEIDFDAEKAEQLSPSDVIMIMNEMPLGYKSVLNLYAVEKFSHKEIAGKLGISVGTSKSQLAKARRMLKVLIAEKLKSATYEN
jgi:RNA polymerase sigma factor (sigma-70 family)